MLRTCTFALSLLAAPLALAGQLATPGREWLQYSTPEEAGWSSPKLDSAHALATTLGSATLFAVHRGHVVAAWGPVDLPLNVYSVRKSLVSALFGVYHRKGRVDLKASMRQLGVNDLSPLTDTEAAATIRDLMTARSGIYLPAAYEPPGNAARRPERGSREPGTHWWYNNWDFNALGGIFEQLSGRTVFEAFRDEIAEPIGMQDFSLTNTFEWLEPGKSRFPAHLFRLSARDLARFGTLYLRRGQWNDHEVLTPEWVTESTAPHASQPNGRNQYGYMWWVNRGDPAATLTVERHDRYTARGNGGQQILVIPALDFVLVHQVDLDRHAEVPFTEMQRLFSMILDARTGAPVPTPRLVSVQPKALGTAPRPPLPLTTTTIPDATLDAVAGDYLSPPADTLTLFRFRDRLFLRTSGIEIELFARQGGGFHSTWYPLTLETSSDDRGVRQRIVLQLAGSRVEATRVGGGG